MKFKSFKIFRNDYTHLKTTMSIYRSIVWFTKGMSEYTKQGYEKAAVHFRSADLEVDLKEKSVMVTGANSGIGKVCALEGKLHSYKRLLLFF